MSRSYSSSASNYPAADAIELDSLASDTVDLTFFPRAVYVGTTGSLKVVTSEGSTVTFANACGVIPVAVKRVFSTGTTASDIVGLV